MPSTLNNLAFCKRLVISSKLGTFLYPLTGFEEEGDDDGRPPPRGESISSGDSALAGLMTRLLLALLCWSTCSVVKVELLLGGTSTASDDVPSVLLSADDGTGEMERRSSVLGGLASVESARLISLL